MQFRGKSNGEPGKDWHSEIEVAEREVTIHLRRRNCPEPSQITRSCICKDFPSVAVRGVCSLRCLVNMSRSLGGLVFPSVVPARDITVLRKIAEQTGLNRVTWHGFRRGGDVRPLGVWD